MSFILIFVIFWSLNFLLFFGKDISFCLIFYIFTISNFVLFFIFILWRILLYKLSYFFLELKFLFIQVYIYILLCSDTSTA